MKTKLTKSLAALVVATLAVGATAAPPQNGGFKIQDSSRNPESQILNPGYIDTLVLKKLKRLNIPTSPRCSDSEFIRRAYLDACGVLPTAEEVEKFLADADPKKREKLVDSLLEREEFVDYWTYKWCDLLLVSSRKLNSRQMWSFYNWIRDSVKQNKPWDVFVREIITATGSNIENGAANYYVLHKETIDLTETTTQAFLGMSIMCARCHNHPLEKWTTQDYYGFANLFARVSLKNGDTPGEVLVFPSPHGDILHPRMGKPLPPKPLDGKPIPLDWQGDRRVHLANWLTSPDNPYFAKALVNRVWRHFMGRGLVEAEDDLRLTNPPSNAELLDALVRDFVAHKFDVKHLIRIIMLSETYQRSSEPVKGNEHDNRFYSRYIVKRLPAEVMLDVISQVTGVPTEFAGYPKGYRALQLPDSKVPSYFLDAFGRPQREQTCACERQQETSVQQALHLISGNTLNEKLRTKGNVIDRWLEQGLTDEQIITRLYLSALSRYPTDEERNRLLAILSEATVTQSPSHPVTRREAAEDIFWAVLTGKEFLFNR